MERRVRAENPLKVLARVLVAAKRPFSQHDVYVQDASRMERTWKADFGLPKRLEAKTISTGKHRFHLFGRLSRISVGLCGMSLRLVFCDSTWVFSFRICGALSRRHVTVIAPSCSKVDSMERATFLDATSTKLDFRNLKAVSRHMLGPYSSLSSGLFHWRWSTL